MNFGFNSSVSGLYAASAQVYASAQNIVITSYSIHYTKLYDGVRLRSNIALRA